MDKRPIGMFDSGIGGITVFSEVIKQNQNEDIIYLGDTQRFPYGAKSTETIIEISKRCIEFLVKQNVKMIVIACGTATSQALEVLKKEFDVPIIGIINPTVESIKKENREHQIVGVIGTKGTINSNSWEKALKENIENITVINRACPMLAPLAEQGWIENNVAKAAVGEYMEIFKDKNIDKLILGCTHYPLFKELIREELGEDVELINTGEKLAIYLKDFLEKSNLKNSEVHKPKYQIYLTDTETSFIDVAKTLIKDKSIIDKVKRAGDI